MEFSKKLSDFKAVDAQVGLGGPCLDFAHRSGGWGVHRQPRHRQDDAHELCRAQGVSRFHLLLRILLVKSIKFMTTLSAFLLKGIKFPIICDRDGDFSRAFGVLKVNGEDFGAARAVFETLALLQIFLFFIFFTAVGCARP